MAKVVRYRTISVRMNEEEYDRFCKAKAKMRGKGANAPVPTNSHVLKTCIELYLGRSAR